MPDDSLDFDATLQKLAAGNIVFERYLLKRLIGKGRYGDVWEALDQRLDHAVALKFLVNHPHYERLSQRIGRCINLTHPNIVRTFDFVGDKSLCAVVMELMTGPTLAQSLREKEPPFFEASEVVPWARDLFSALDHAWRNGRIVHGDIRPANLFVTKSGSLKIADFAFAPVREGRSLLADDAADEGGVSLPCLSPQVVAGEPALHSDDLYSASACLYELLTGKPVFPGGNLIVQIQRKTPPTITERRTELNRKGDAVPKAFEQITARCLAKEREERPASAAEVVTLLQEASTKTGRTRERTASAPGASRWSGALGHPIALLILVLALGGGAFFWFVVKPGREEIVRRRAEYNALSAADATAQTSIDARIKDWQAFIDRSLLNDVSFNDEDERIAGLADVRLIELKKTAEDERRARKIEEQLIADKTEKLRDAIREEKKTAVPADASSGVLAARADAWSKLIASHATKDSPQTEEFKKFIAEATAERDKLKARLDGAKEEENKKLQLEETMRLIAVSWTEDASARLVNVKSLCADEAKSPLEKTESIKALLEHLKKNPPERAKVAAMRFLLEADALQKEWSQRAATVPPKTPLGIKELFARSPYAEETLKTTLLKSESEKDSARLVGAIQKTVLSQSQEKIFAEPGIEFEGSKSAKADGATGKTTHGAIVAFQKLPAKKLAPNAELDTATLAALGLDKIDLAALVEKEKKAWQDEQNKMAEASEAQSTEGKTSVSSSGKTSASSGKTSSSSGGGGRSKGNSKWKTQPPPKSKYDKPMGKTWETLDRAAGRIDPVEWKKHEIWLQYCEWLSNQ